MTTRFTQWCTLPTDIGNFRMYDCEDEYVRVVCMGDLQDQGPAPLLRMHSSCIASEVFGARDCDCADQLREAMKAIAAEGRGIIVHLHQEGRGQGLSRKIRAVRYMEQHAVDTAEAFDALGFPQDVREYEPVVELLRWLDISRVRLISNNPRKTRYLKAHGIAVSGRRTHPPIRPQTALYLRSKNEKLGHCIPLDEDATADTPVQFYHSDQAWGELSNFSRHAVHLSGRIWPTVEHFYQAHKFADAGHQERIRRCASPMAAKLAVGEFTSDQKRDDWPQAKEAVMLEGLRAKFTQHPDLAARLLASYDRVLVEHTENDSYWGDGGDGRGQNRLGHLLMQVRAELQLTHVATQSP